MNQTEDDAIHRERGRRGRSRTRPEDEGRVIPFRPRHPPAASGGEVAYFDAHEARFRKRGGGDSLPRRRRRSRAPQLGPICCRRRDRSLTTRCFEPVHQRGRALRACPHIREARRGAGRRVLQRFQGHHPRIGGGGASILRDAGDRDHGRAAEGRIPSAPATRWPAAHGRSTRSARAGRWIREALRATSARCMKRTGRTAVAAAHLRRGRATPFCSRPAARPSTCSATTRAGQHLPAGLPRPVPSGEPRNSIWPSDSPPTACSSASRSFSSAGLLNAVERVGPFSERAAPA